MDLAAYLDYTDDHGGTTDRNDRHKSPNGARFTGHKLQALVKNKQLNNQNKQRLKQVFKNYEVRPGLTTKIPLSRDHGYDSIDNLVAHLYADFILETGFADRWLEYGESVKTQGYDTSNKNSKDRMIYRLFYLCFKPFHFNFNNQYPLLWAPSSWMGRYLQVKCMAKMISKKRTPSFLEKLVWRISVLIGGYNKDQDSKGLSSFLIEVAHAQGEFKLTVKAWVYLFKRRFKSGLGEVLFRYLNDKSHPLILDLWGYFV